jgi:hypothetical protein
MGNSDELDLIRKRHEEEIERIRAMTNDEVKKKYEESLNFHLKKEDFENLEKKYNSDISGSSFVNYYS